MKLLTLNTMKQDSHKTLAVVMRCDYGLWGAAFLRMLNENKYRNNE